MRVLVIGGTGTVGRGVVPVLREDGHEVTVYARGTTPNPFGNSVTLLQGDRFDHGSFVDDVRDRDVEAVIDLACFSADDARSDLRAFEHVEHLIFVSSTAIFEGPLPFVPADESPAPNARHPYGRGKIEAEAVFREAHESSGFPMTVVRPSHVLGPGKPLLRQLGLSGNWIARILADKPVLVTCGGQTYANHCRARDAGRGLAGLLGREETVGETYNMNGPAMTWSDYHDRVGEMLDRTVRQVDAPAKFVLEHWPEDTYLLDRFHRWHHHHTDEKLRRTVSAYEPDAFREEELIPVVEWMRRHDAVESPRLDRIEDRMIETVRSLSLSESDSSSGGFLRDLLGG